ncbi:MAG: L-fuconate dehydratase (EC, type 2 [uncultured Paraburkholderia sp.]|nr:MAG: L-fuconate dehydratase (EC, type 2 [uncultured Paraburkholderia sp.]
MTDITVASALTQPPMLQGYLRSDGRKGIRNVVAVAYLVECAARASNSPRNKRCRWR